MQQKIIIDFCENSHHETNGSDYKGVHTNTPKKERMEKTHNLMCQKTTKTKTNKILIFQK